MGQLFISYSRKDTEIARRITTRFEKEGMEAWVDWQDIPPSVDWMIEIQKGIEEADIFLLLTSPDSLRSPVVADELAHAIKNGKRIIPVIVRDIDSKTAPATISHLNWIFFYGTDDDFETSFGKLLIAIRTDFDWVQAHKRLQVRALEWERNKKEASYLLRGMDLQDAEAQLVVNGEKPPRPTDLQREYVTQSTKVQAEEQERQKAREQQLELEKKMGTRLRRLTYIILGVFTVAFVALFFWLNKVTSDLAINSIKDQMLALVETSVCFINGDEYADFANAYPKAGTNNVYTDFYYQNLAYFMDDVRATNENVKAAFSLYVITKDKTTGALDILVSTTKDITFRTPMDVNDPKSVHNIGLQRTVAGTEIYVDQFGSWISACSPILNSKNQSVGALCADFSAGLLDDTRQNVATTLGFAFLAIYPALVVLVVFSTRSFSRSLGKFRIKPASS
jgi:hypothetical protein